MRTFSVKEVREITGLNWKQLYEYKEGIPGIGPINDAGYKQYSEEDVHKLIQASLFAKLGAKPKEINKAFTNENYNKNAVLNELEIKANKKLIEIKDILTVISIFKDLADVPFYIDPYAISDLHTYAERIRALMESEDTKRFSVYLINGGEEKLINELKKFSLVTEETIEEPSTKELVRSLKKHGESETGINGNRFLLVIANDLLAAAGFREWVDGEIKEGFSDVVGIAIVNYLWEEFYASAKEVVLDLIDLVGFSYSDSRVSKDIHDIAYKLKEAFGFGTIDELVSQIRILGVCVKVQVDDDDMEEFEEFIDYLVKGIEYYVSIKDI